MVAGAYWQVGTTTDGGIVRNPITISPACSPRKKIVYFGFLVECSKEVRGNSKCVFYWQPNNVRFPRGLHCFHTTWTQGGEGAKETHFSFLRSF